MLIVLNGASLVRGYFVLARIFFVAIVMFLVLGALGTALGAVFGTEVVCFSEDDLSQSIHTVYGWDAVVSERSGQDCDPVYGG